MIVAPHLCYPLFFLTRSPELLPGLLKHCAQYLMIATGESATAPPAR
jgi:hypothetical protein